MEYDRIRYKCVVNDDDQYSIWFDGRENPKGWKDTGCAGTKAECLAFIEKIWTDMRPRSLRAQMDCADVSLAPARP